MPERINIMSIGFNTASGRYYCNKKQKSLLFQRLKVSIPQAVGTIAMRNHAYHMVWDHEVSIPQAVGTIAI